MNKKYLRLIAVILAVAAAAVSFSLTACSNKKTSDDKGQTEKQEVKKAETITVAPCTEEEAKRFGEEVIGSWSSFASDGSAVVYTFNEDGTAVYHKDGEKDADYTYSFEDGVFTIKTDNKDFAYQCSMDAVGMLAKYSHGEVMNYYSIRAETIPDFNGCIEIDGDFLYMGAMCLCRSDKLTGFDENTIEGEWLGVSGDTAVFAADGTYTYHDGGQEIEGKYAVDPDSGILTITLSKEKEYDQTHWGIDGRTLHIDQKYFFKIE